MDFAKEAAFVETVLFLESEPLTVKILSNKAQLSEEVIEKYGADVLRLWVLASDYTSDISVSENILKQVSETYRKIRNTARFILGNIDGLDVNNFDYDGILYLAENFSKNISQYFIIS